MKVLQVTEEVYPNRIGGVAKHVHDLSLALLEKDIDVELLVTEVDDNEGFGQLEGRIHRYESLWQTLSLLSNGDYDVVHFHQLGPRPVGFLRNDILQAAAKKAGAASFVTPHGAFDVLVEPPDVEQSKYPSFALKTYLKYLEFVGLHFTDVVVGVSPHQVDVMTQNGLAEEKVKLVPNALPTDFFEKPHKSFRDVYEIPSDDDVVFFIGRITPRKRVDELIHAIAEIVNSHPNLHLVLAGPDDEAGTVSELESLSSDLGVKDAVSFIGPISEDMKKAALADSDIFVNPSEYEAFGITTLESMAFGTPVISADNDGGQYVLNDGKYGLLYSCGDIEELSDAMNQLLADTTIYEEYEACSRQRAKEFVWEDIIETLIDSYRRASGET